MTWKKIKGTREIRGLRGLMLYWDMVDILKNLAGIWHWNVAASIRKTQLGSLLLTWFDFNPSMNKQLQPLYSVGWNYLSILKRQWYNLWSLGMDKLFRAMLFWACVYLSTLGLKSIHVSKRVPDIQLICFRSSCYALLLMLASIGERQISTTLLYTRSWYLYICYEGTDNMDIYD